MYQLQSRTTGDILPVFYFVKMPEGETRSVTEFVVVPNKTDWNDPDNCDKVYIGAVLADDKLTDENERLRSTDVAAMVVDLDQTDTVSSVIVSDPAKGEKDEKRDPTERNDEGRGLRALDESAEPDGHVFQDA